MAIRLVLADDHPIVLHGLERIFERFPEFSVVGACLDGDTALDVIRAAPPDVLVLDLQMPGRSGLEVMRAIAAERIPCRTVILAAAVTDEDAVEAARLGAWGVVKKDAPPDTLLGCVRAVHAGQRWLAGKPFRTSAMDPPSEPADGQSLRPLTPRETDVLRMTAQGLRNRAIAERLSITEGTVKIHLHNIYEKLGVDGRLALVLYAQNNRLL